MEKNVKVTLNQKGLGNAGMLKDALVSIPDGASIGFRTIKGDRPWESDAHELIFEWTEKL